jgi:hypothetical protein
MSVKAVRSGRLSKDRPENVIRIFIPAQPASNNVAAYLMLKLIQSFESSALLFSGEVQAKRTAMNREMVRDKSEKKLLV